MPPRADRDPLRHNREFRLLWVGQALSDLGSRVAQVAYPLLVLGTTGSAAKAGVVGFAQFVPIVLLALPAGVLVDQLDRKRLMIACDGVRALALAAIPVALAAGSVPYGLIVAVAFVDGSGFVFFYVAERSVLPQLVPRDQLGEAVARNESRTFAAMLAGPPLGGLLYGLARSVPSLVDAVSYAASTIGMAMIKTEFQESRVGVEPGGLSDGLRWLWRQRFFRACSVLFSASNPVFTGLTLLIVLLAKRGGASSALVGVMLGSAAAGGLTGALLAPRVQRMITARAVLISETCVLAATLPLLLLTHDALLLGLIVAGAELLTPVTNSIIVSYRVALSPDRLQGRIQAASSLISMSAGWLGPLAVGLLIASAGTTATILALTGWVVVLAVGAVTAPALRHAPRLD